MFSKLYLCALSAFVVVAASGCSSPFDSRDSYALTMPPEVRYPSQSVYREGEDHESAPQADDEIANHPDEYIRYALFHSPEVEAAYQRWRAASERLPQVRTLPDPRLNFGFFLNEVETRVGPQQARVGLQQTFPWIGKLQAREDAAAKGALAAWYRYQEAQLRVAERVMIALHDLAYLDRATAITRESYELLVSFEEVVRARYRLGSGSHPELIRIQVELGQLNDRVVQLESMRGSYVAALNAVLNRPSGTAVPLAGNLPVWLVDDDAEKIVNLARGSSPVLASMNQRIEQARIETEVARKDGYPDLTVGIDFIVTDEAAGPTIAESGDDPIMLSFGMNLPIWREKYNAGVRESIANRLSISHQRQAAGNTLSAQVHQAWFEHTDAARRARLYEDSLIPKAKESLAASMVGFRSGDSEFLDLLDTQRTLLEFAITAQRARADSGKALALLNRLVGEPVQTHTQTSNHKTDEVQP